MVERRFYVDDHLQGLCADDAVERRRRHGVGPREIGHERRLRVARDGVQDVAARDAGAAELPRVPVVADLEHPSPYVVRMRAEELLDVVAIDREPAVEPDDPAHRREPPERAELDRPAARPLEPVAMLPRPEPSAQGDRQPIRDRGHHVGLFTQRKPAKLYHWKNVSTISKPFRWKSARFSSMRYGTRTFSSASRFPAISASEYAFRRLKS